MRRWLFIPLAFFLAAPVEAQLRVTRDATIEVSSTAVGVDPATFAGMAACVFVTEDNDIRWRMNGSAPTGSVGTLLKVGSVLTLTNLTDVQQSLFIRSGSEDGAISVTCYPTSGDVALSGSGGAAAGEITGEVTTELTLQEADDASIAGGQTADAVIGFSMAFDGTVWRRLTFGSAGTASAQVLTIQGIASMTPVAVSGTVTSELSATDNAVLDAIAADTAFLETSKAPVAPGAATATTAFLIAGTYNAAGVSLDDTEQAGLQLDADGNVLVASPDLLAELSSVAGTLETIDGKLNVDATHGDVLKASGPQIIIEAKTVDGATLPNVVSEGQPVRGAGTAWGGGYQVRASLDGLYAEKIDPCASEEKTTTPISLTADAVIIAAASAKKNYICALVIGSGAAEIVSITEGTGTVCGTSEAALVGSTTDAEGMPFGAGGGLSAIGGSSTIIAGKSANVDTCLNVSGTERVSGFVTWVQR